MLIQAENSVCWICIFRGVTSHQHHSNQNTSKAKTKSNKIREALNTKAIRKSKQNSEPR